jgi:hypothetical protein
MRHKIDSSTSVIIFETANPLSSEPSERYSYYVIYTDRAGQERESETQAGFASAATASLMRKRTLAAWTLSLKSKRFQHRARRGNTTCTCAKRVAATIGVLIPLARSQGNSYPRE